MTDKFGNWVDEPDAITHFNNTGECVCGGADLYPPHGRFYDHYWCADCERIYLQGGEEGTAIPPQYILQTDEDGLVPANTDWEAFNLLTEHELDVQDYIEIHPRTLENGEAWLWAADGFFIGYLIYRGGTLRTTVIVEGYRQQGHGSEFISRWFERKDEETLSVIAFDRTKPFLENKLEMRVDYC